MKKIYKQYLEAIMMNDEDKVKIIIPVTAGLIVKEGENGEKLLLLIQRAKEDHWPNFWEAPRGKCDKPMGEKGQYLLPIREFRYHAIVTDDSQHSPAAIMKFALKRANMENYLKELPESLKSMVLLKYLNLKGNLLTSLPEFLGNYSKMRELYLGSNYINEIPESIGNMAFLRILSAGSNKLKTLPKSLGRLKNLEKLILNTNELVSLPNSLVNLRNLKHLNLTFNRLGDFPIIIEILREYGCKVILSNEDYDPFELSNDGILSALNDNIPYSTNDLAKKMKIMTDIDLRTLKFKLKGLADKGLLLIYKKDNRNVWKIK